MNQLNEMNISLKDELEMLLISSNEKKIERDECMTKVYI